MLNALLARKILLSTLKVWESGAGVKTVTSVRSVMDPLHGRKLGIVRMFGSNVTDVISTIYNGDGCGMRNGWLVR